MTCLNHYFQSFSSYYLQVVLKSVRIIEDKVKCGLLRRRFVKQKAAAIKIQAFWKAYYQRYDKHRAGGCNWSHDHPFPVCYRQQYLKFKLNVSRLQANLRCRWQRRFYLQHKQQLAAERDVRWAEAQAMKVSGCSMFDT